MNRLNSSASTLRVNTSPLSIMDWARANAVLSFLFSSATVSVPVSVISSTSIFSCSALSRTMPISRYFCISGPRLYSPLSLPRPEESSQKFLMALATNFVGAKISSPVPGSLILAMFPSSPATSVSPALIAFLSKLSSVMRRILEPIALLIPLRKSNPRVN